ncbi:hypothetical protein H4Q26_005678 [Puccinia striiformis f. sp. tritici PST-130]|nr:hypothetical protein H4Q26_005678 [Puccinia striiformis f. sp. tritici PST-130]
MAIKRFKHEISKPQILKRIEGFACKLQNREVIMTLDNSRTVTSFLQAAAKNKRKFTVINLETAHHLAERTLSKKLTNSVPKIPNIDSYRVADGSILAKSGSLGLALAAKVHNVPVVPDQVLSVDELQDSIDLSSKSSF